MYKEKMMMKWYPAFSGKSWQVSLIITDHLKF